MTIENTWKKYHRGWVEFDWISEDITPEAFMKAIGESIYVRRGGRAKETDKDGIVYIKNLNVKGITDDHTPHRKDRSEE